jgi:hypothetical protein
MTISDSTLLLIANGLEFPSDKAGRLIARELLERRDKLVAAAAEWLFTEYSAGLGQ